MALPLESPAEPEAPAWLVSFGDMMTLILTFFILLVSLSHQRNYSLIASGLGSFVSALRAHGLPGILAERDRREVFEHFRRRFNLPPESDPDRREEHVFASQDELLRASLVESLRPHAELFQPQVALFAPGSADPTPASLDYLERLAETLRPGRGQLLILEGHALDAGERFAHDNRWLAFERARAVRKHLLERHGFDPRRVEARAWLRESEREGNGMRCVDARLLTPKEASR